MVSGHIGDIGNHIYRSSESAGAGKSSISNLNTTLKTTPPVEPKQSRALPLWILLVTLVLGNLFFQTEGVQPSYNFLIEGNAAALAADVAIDGKPVGKINEYTDTGVKIYGLRCRLTDGSHTVTITKDGFEPVTTKVLLQGEDYLGFRLKSK